MNNKGICLHLKAGKNKKKNLSAAFINKLGDKEMEHTTNDIKNIYERERGHIKACLLSCNCSETGPIL